ncbi:HigA family addiction module antitoxin [Kiloniella sp.]|uniref:HigA family addiction module antitoxin n=1 Tax=Kiloniella sp. TaxID=1938587 RepID=UPI003B02686D
MTNEIPIMHPGAVLKMEFLDEYNITAYKLAKDIDVPTNRITGILKGDRAITTDTALRLGKYFNTSAEVWTSLQADYEMRLARADKDIMDGLDKIHPVAA